MTLLGHEGFDHQAAVADMLNDRATTTRTWQWSAQNGASIQAGTLFYGYGKCLQLGSGGWAELTLTTSIASGYIGFHLQIPSASAFAIANWNSHGGGNQPVIATGGATGGQVGVIFNPNNGSISVYRGIGIGGGAPFGSAALLGTSANNVFPVGSAFFVEVFTTIHASAGVVTVKVNGTTILGLTAQNTSNDGTALFDSWFPIGGPGANPQIDNMYLLDTAGAAPFNTFLTDGGSIPRVYTLFPSANSSVTWTPAAGSNFSEVNETAMDGDTTYNSSSTVGNTDLFATAGIPATLTPLALQITLSARQDAAGSLAVQTALQSGVAALATGQSLIGNASYAYQRDIWTTDPNTGAAWTRAALNAALIGYNESV